MSVKPLKILFKCFSKTINDGIPYQGSCARDYGGIFVSQDCDLFIMQNGVMSPGFGNPSLSFGSETARYEPSFYSPDSVDNTRSWFPPYFSHSVRIDNRSTDKYMVDTICMPPDTSLKILATRWFPSKREDLLTPASIRSGVHAILFQNDSGNNFVVGSYCQYGSNNVDNNINNQNFRDAVNNISNWYANIPYIMCCNLSMFRSDVYTIVDSIANAIAEPSPNDNLTLVAQSGLNQTLNNNDSNYVITNTTITKLRTLPTLGFKTWPNYTEYSSIIVTCENIRKGVDGGGTYNTSSSWNIPGGTLTNFLNT